MDTIQYLKSLLFKHIILSNSENELVELLDKSEDSLCLFIDLLTDTYELDEKFFKLDKTIVDKVFYVFNNYRYEKRFKMFNETVNNYIRAFNPLLRIDEEDRRIIRNKYMDYESGMRGLNIHNDFELFFLLKNDIIVYQTLFEGSKNETTVYLIEEATYNFLNRCPDIYENDSILNNTLEILCSKKPNLNIRENRVRKTLIKEMNNLKK